MRSLCQGLWEEQICVRHADVESVRLLSEVRHLPEAMHSRGSENPERRCTIVCVKRVQPMLSRTTTHIPTQLGTTLSILVRGRQARMRPV